jgi:phosphoglycerol transferase MdoB-like AlkP superfamily enzyme
VSNFLPFIKRTFLLLCIYSVCRILFFVFNLKSFSDAGIFEFIIGLRFDLSAIFLLNFPVFVFAALPFGFTEKALYKKIISIVFISINAIALTFNCADIGYFPFNNKRSTMELFAIVGSENDFWQLLPSYIKDFWYLFLLLFSLIILLIYGEIKINFKAVKTVPQSFLKRFVSFLIIAVITLIGSRGGVQYIPLHIMHASKYTSASNTALVLNTPFTLIKSFGSSEIKPNTYFAENELENYITLKKHYTFKGKFLPMNVVIIIMESFSKEYIGALSGKASYTPFLDSLIQESFVFKNAFANAQKSMDGIPAILSSIPLMMDNSYITSQYSTNKTIELAHLLKEEGYITSFYHGGKTGTMGFDAYAKSAGYENYYGKENYSGPESDDDGHWGIYDEPYFLYAADELNKSKSPFLSVLFSLSSHHPYSVPKELENNFSEGTLPIHKSVQYADYALKRFFEKASTQPWFKNTLFVITADHTSLSEEGFYRNSAGMFQIPIIFYSPLLKLNGQSEIATQQIDINPSILHLLRYQKPFFNFGKNAFDTTLYHYAINYYNGIYQLNDDSLHLQFNGEEFIGMYKYKEDSLLRHNLVRENQVPDNAANTLKAFIQAYQQAMVKNQLSLPAP